MKDFGTFQTCTPALIDVLDQAQRAALTSAPVFISGPTGSGRRTLAQWIHDRASARGLFRSWDGRANLVVTAGETIFLENIHEWDEDRLDLVVRTIEEEKKMNPSRVRWMASSELGAEEWRLRGPRSRDLAYRLCVLNLRVPGLQERADDIGPLAELFLKVGSLVHGVPSRALSQEARRSLANHSWRGHVAELTNVLERALLRASGETIEPHDLEFWADPPTASPLTLGQTGITLSEMEKKLILQTLSLTGQNKTQAARLLGISIRTLRNKLHLYKDEGRVHEQLYV